MTSKQQTETVKSTESTMNVNKKFIKILKSSFRIMSGDYEGQILETHQKYIDIIDVKMDRLFREVINLKDEKFDDCVTLALSYLYMSYAYIDSENKTLILGKKYLTKSLELLQNKELDCKAILIAMRSHNELSYIETIAQNIIEAESHLNKAMELYAMFTEEDDYPTPVDVASILNIEDEANSKCLLNEIYRATLEGLLDMEETTFLHSKRTDIPKAVIYMHKLLVKKLNAADTDHAMWAIYSANLSTYFTKYGRFIEARNHLTAANFMIQKYFLNVYQKVEESNLSIIENVSKDMQVYKYASALIANYWAKYGLALLRLSKQTMIHDTEEKLCEASTSQSSESKCSTKSKRQPKDLLIFSDIETDLKEFTAPITNKCPLDYKEAKKVFVNVLKWYNDVKAYVISDTIDNVLVDKLEDECSIALSISMAYKYLTYYEHDKSNKLKLHKRQIEIIEKVMEISKPTAGTEIYKQLCIELIFSYTTIIDTMTEHLHADKPGLSEKESLEVKQWVTRCLTSLKLYSNPFKMSINHEH